MSFFKSGMIFCTIRYIFIYYTYKLTMFKKFRETWLLLLAFRGINSFFLTFWSKLMILFNVFSLSWRNWNDDKMRMNDEGKKSLPDTLLTEQMANGPKVDPSNQEVRLWTWIFGNSSNSSSLSPRSTYNNKFSNTDKNSSLHSFLTC